MESSDYNKKETDRAIESKLEATSSGGGNMMWGRQYDMEE